MPQTLSEEALESRNKDIRNYRQRFARKTSRTDNLIDVLKRLLYSSDPLFCLFRHSPNMKVSRYSPAVQSLFLQPAATVIDMDQF